MVGCFSFFASQKLERCRHFMAASAAFSGFWLFVALLTPTKQRDLGKDGLALAAIAVVAAVVAAAPPSPRRGSTSTARSSPKGAVPRGRRCRRVPRVRAPPWCVCPDVRAWWGSRQSVVTTPPEKAVDDAPRLSRSDPRRGGGSRRARRPRGGRAAAAAAHGVPAQSMVWYFLLRHYWARLLASELLGGPRASTRH